MPVAVVVLQAKQPVVKVEPDSSTSEGSGSASEESEYDASDEEEPHSTTVALTPSTGQEPTQDGQDALGSDEPRSWSPVRFP